jgi:diadenosine tetraphosphate (Ap4A) HIT family hydrolase
MAVTDPDCPLCQGAGGPLVFQAPAFRVIRAQEAGFPAFYRLVWQAHVAEFSDLPPTDRATCVEALVQVERALREVLAPAKINLAALGNMVAHLHWHVIARFTGDSHFPGAVWAAPVRAADPAQLAAVAARLPQVEEQIVQRLRRLAPPA